ncbi:MAG: FkbM family methyltransferase [Clostridia bacterium]|nr:FkbM family methyltransferase [Clostridia bacterium]
MEKSCNLPEYPCTRDVWDVLKSESRPIVVYGMGNGADKLFRRFEKYGIHVSDVFASDGFVRGHSYRGFKVKSFSEIKATYPDFVIVLSFASNRRDVVEMLADIDSNYEMYVPDMPVADEDEYFDREFYNANYEKILSVYGMLADGLSRHIYASVINYRLSGKLSYLLTSYSEKEEMYSLLLRKNVRVAIDAGAYNGDTASEAIKYFPSVEKIYALEPDPKNYKRLLRFAQGEGRVMPINAAAWCESAEGSFIGSGNRNSSVSSTASYQHTKSAVSLLRIDDVTDDEIDYIKYDVEGAELEAIVGSSGIIKKFHPAMLVSLYHRSRDIFFLPDYLCGKYAGYDMYLRRMYSVPAWEIDLLMIPRT